MVNSSGNQAAQDVAKKAMVAVAERIASGMTEAQIAGLAEEQMRALGAEGWWYHNVGALVLVGEARSKLSVSGRDFCGAGARIHCGGCGNRIYRKLFHGEKTFACIRMLEQMEF